MTLLAWLLGCGEPVGDELPPIHVDTVGSVRCMDDTDPALQASSRGLTSGVVGVWLEVRAVDLWDRAYALIEVDYYDWTGTFPLDFASDCGGAAAASYRMRWRIWDGRDDVVEALELERGGDTGPTDSPID